MVDIKASRQTDLMGTCGRAIEIINKSGARSIRIDDGGTGLNEFDKVLLPVEPLTQRLAFPLENLLAEPRAIGRSDPDLLPLI